MVQIPLAQLLRRGIVFGVVVAVGKAKSALVGIGDYLAGISKVLDGLEAEEYIVSRHGRCHFGEFLPGTDFGDALEHGLERSRAFRLDCLLVRAGSVIVPELLRDRIALWVSSGRRLQNVAESRRILVLHFRIRVPRGLVGRDGIVLDPPSAGIGEKVHAGIDASIHRCDVQRRLMLCRMRLLCSGESQKRCQEQRSCRSAEDCHERTSWGMSWRTGKYMPAAEESAVRLLGLVICKLAPDQWVRGYVVRGDHLAFAQVDGTVAGMNREQAASAVQLSVNVIGANFAFR